MNFQERLLNVIPAGAHTYSRGFDQFPANAPQILKKGKGAYVYDENNNKYLDYGMALRAVNIGYAEDEINAASNKIISTQKVENGYVRPVAWRGSEMMAISAQHTKIHVAIATWEWGSYFDPKLKIEGIKLNISNWRRPAPNTIPWDTKASGLYMICTLSKHEAEKQGYTDSLMLDHEGNVAEATGANIFFKDKNGDLHTPIPDSFLDGITRRTVIEIAKSKNIKVHERKIKPEELKNFVGCFLTGTAAEVTPVSCIAENQFKVCDLIIDLNESYQSVVKKKKTAA